MLYLSPKRAFASVMTTEFKKFGFVNYMDPEAKGKGKKVNRLFCSLESLDRFVRELHPHLYNKLDLLIIDESESIFSVVSSETLRSNEPINNLLTLTHVMKSAGVVVAMDAHMCDRTVEPIAKVRKIDQNSAYFLQNSFKPEPRFCNLVRKNIQGTIVSELNDSLSKGKRCVAIIGSKKFADGLVQSVNELHGGRKQIKYYSRDNKLDGTVDVREEWKTCDLLVYTPCITCGVNFPRVSQDDGEIATASTDYEVLYVTTSTTGSCIFRDMIQASHRVRHFTERTMTLGLGIRPVPAPHLFPVTFGEVADSLHKLKDINDLTCCKSITVEEAADDLVVKEDRDVKNLRWVFRTMVFNQLERNLNVRYLPQVLREHFRRENIRITREMCTSEENMVHQSVFTVADDDWKWDEIELIDDATYRQYATNEVNQRSFVDLGRER